MKGKENALSNNGGLITRCGACVCFFSANVASFYFFVGCFIAPCFSSRVFIPFTYLHPPAHQLMCSKKKKYKQHMLSACLPWKNIKLMLFLVLSNDFDVLMSKKKKNNMKTNYFDAFPSEKHFWKAPCTTIPNSHLMQMYACLYILTKEHTNSTVLLFFLCKEIDIYASSVSLWVGISFLLLIWYIVDGLPLFLFIY